MKSNSPPEPVKLAYAKSEISSVNPPAELTPPPQTSTGDTLQDLISRMREAKKNRTRFHLTESDCNRMCTNATELNMASGHLIVAEGELIKNVYRIKKGQVSLVKTGVKLYDLSAVSSFLFVLKQVFIYFMNRDTFLEKACSFEGMLRTASVLH